jgi:Fe-Mn family superoxide dismutase
MQPDTIAETIHELPPLPYDVDALAPHISAETLEYHHGKHHRAYVTRVNELVKGTSFEAMSVAQILEKATGTLFNNAAQAWNHAFYWNCLTPRQGSRPSAELTRAIEGAFGSLERLEVQFKAAAAAKFGSGWTWLVKHPDGTLAVENTDDADTPVCRNQAPLLVCDVWEHAYYIDYRNQRARYIDAFWRLANWEFASLAFNGR